MQVDQIPSGYKLTEVGIIPSDWDVVKLRDVFNKITGGGTPRRERKEYWNGDIFWATVKDLSSFDPNSTQETITVEGLKLSASNLILKGTPIISTRMALGKIVIYDVDVAINQDLKALFLKPIVDTKFFCHWFNYNATNVSKLGGGSTVQGITIDDLKNINFYFPPIEEQKRIAQVLSDIDELIRSLDELIIKKRNIKQGTMQLLLTGKQRLPGYSGEWEVKTLGEINQVTAGGTPSTLTKEYWDGNIKWMNSGELNLKKVFDVEGRITQLGLNNSSAKILPVKSVLIGLAGQGKTRGTVAINMVELCTNQSVAAILPSNSLIAEYLYYNLDNRYNELRNLSTGEGGRGGLNLKIIKSLLIPIPPLEEQKAIARILSDMDEEIEVLEQKRNKYQDIKKGMMQELLTGKTRLV